MMRTANPTLKSGVFDRFAGVAPAEHAMTLGGTIAKTFALLALLIATGVVGWMYPSPPVIIASALTAFLVAIVTTFRPQSSPYLAPVYALLEGFVLGGISALFATKFEGLVPQAVLLTLAVFGIMLTLYTSRVIRVTPLFAMVVIGATLAVALVYIGILVTSLFIPSIYASLPMFGANPIGIAFSVFVVGLAALNLALDFNLVETGVEAGAPKYMEWYAGFGLLVTLVWLYIETLRLLAKLRG